ncbi:MAG: terminase small subunit [Deltaproteobacteria bacterium]|nr:terminase small subunit [Deltaproteobacteria bacterium]
MSLTRKQAAFVAEYLVDKCAAKAAERAGYSPRTANKIASHLMANPAVREAVDVALGKQAARLEITADRVLQGIARIAQFDLADAYDPQTNRLKPIHELPREVRDAIVGVDIHHDGANEPGFTVKVKWASRLEAWRDLGKHLELFTEKHKHELEGAFAELLKGARDRAQRR